MLHPFEAAYANAADPKYRLLDELRAKSAERTAAWQRFESERDRAAEAGLDDEATKTDAPAPR